MTSLSDILDSASMEAADLEHDKVLLTKQLLEKDAQLNETRNQIKALQSNLQIDLAVHVAKEKKVATAHGKAHREWQTSLAALETFLRSINQTLAADAVASTLAERSLTTTNP